MNWAVVWRRRSALMYTVGSWTLLGWAAYSFSDYFERTREEGLPPLSPPPEGRTISEDGLREITVYKSSGRKISVQSTVLYKPNFVPYGTRLHNYVQSFFDDSGGKEK